MGLKQKVEEETKRAMKNQEPVLFSTLRMLLAAIHNREIAKRTKLSKDGTVEDLEKSSELNEEETLEVVRSESKKRREAMVAYEKAGRRESVEKEALELKILQKYLPRELDDEEIEKTVREIIIQIGPVSEKDFGRVMGEAMKKVKGQAAGERVSGAVRKALGL